MQYQNHNSAGGFDQQSTPANIGWDCCIYGDRDECMRIHGTQQAMRAGEEAVWEVEQEEHWPGNSNSDSDISDEEEEDTSSSSSEDTSDDDEDETSDEDEDEDVISGDEEETEDGAYLEHDDYLVEQDYLTQDVYLNHDDYVATTMSRGVITHSHDSQDESYEQTAAHVASVDTITHGYNTQYKSHEKTAVHATSTSSFFQVHNVTKSPNRFLTLAGKAKEHLRDENNRKKAVETFQNGMREVTAFMAEIQAMQGAAVPKRVGQKGNGKELAAICGKVAMKRLKK